MNPGNNEPRHVAGAGGRISGAVAAGTKLPHTSDIPREGLSARPLVLITRGRVEYTAKCPGCDNWHRHRKLGDVQGPCGTFYELQPRRGRSRGK